MSSYNEYARKLDAAFKEARKEHDAALEEYKKAERDARDESDPVKKKVREAERDEKAKALKETQRKAWANFRSTRDSLDRELRAAVEKAQLADPDAVDTNAVTLLNSGMLTAADLAGMADKYADNPTMLRLIGNHARGLAGNERDPETRKGLNAVYYSCANRKPATLENWDALKTVTEHFSGERNPHNGADVISNLADHWDDDSVQEAIENF